MKPRNLPGPTDKSKITKDNLSTRNQNISHFERIQSVTSDVFLVKMNIIHFKFSKTKNNSKRIFLINKI